MGERTGAGRGLDPSGELPLPRRAEVFGYLSLSLQAELAGVIAPAELAELVTEMDADDRADLFNEMAPPEQQLLLRDLSKKDCDDIRQLAGHVEGTAGALMTTDYATLNAAMTAQEAIAELRRTAPDKETIYRSYILDEKGRLIGAIRLHELILAADDQLIGDLMDPAPISTTPDTGQEDVAG